MRRIDGLQKSFDVLDVVGSDERDNLVAYFREARPYGNELVAAPLTVIVSAAARIVALLAIDAQQRHAPAYPRPLSRPPPGGDAAFRVDRETCQAVEQLRFVVVDNGGAGTIAVDAVDAEDVEDAEDAVADFVAEARAVVRMNNVFGPRQHKEKLIPRFIALLGAGEKLTIQGAGRQVRSFVHVADVARAFGLILAKGAVGETYNIGSDAEFSVLEIAQKLVDVKFGGARRVADCTVFVADRPFNDTRYYISSRKLEKLGWKREVDVDSALAELV